ncbi:MAG: hypothetical protein QF786_00385 [Vicinamibacterales bacterium]|jgi:uncharacterized membrane protein|nr:hypothetical protein [Vicinamibacterales bacterium]MDP7690629.1 hypothetical protein [Vicinamibacterales bacterium]HJN44764.1 hypothetical protein [Vicinamibacterales bacterium]|tara:strand:- start:622 stop:1020 length:399 start_codon:yes stop_codon:yes gene_type:complete
MTDDETPEAPPPTTPPTTPPPPPPPSSGAAAPNRGVMVVISYLWILALVPLFLEKQDSEVQWHAKHGLVLFGVEFFAFAALTILGIGSGGLGCLLLPLVQLAVLALHVVCIAKGLQGERFLIPGISEYANKL